MKNFVTSITLLLLVTFGLTNCTTQEAENDAAIEDQQPEYTANEEQLEYETWMMEIDMNDSLHTGNSLYYSKPTGESVEVEIFINDSSEMVKAVESYTVPGSYSVSRRIFYLRDGVKIATRELFEDSTVTGAAFSERVTFYDSDEKPIATKQRTAAFEESLDYESFTITANSNCTMERVMRVLNREEEFATTFQGFVSDGGATYLIVGEDIDDGFTSTMIVQFVDETIQWLQANEAEAIGKLLKLNFEKRNDGQGFEYQLLYGAAIE